MQTVLGGKNMLFVLIILMCTTMYSKSQIHFPHFSFVISDPVILEQCQQSCPQGGEYAHRMTLTWEQQSKNLDKLYKKHSKDCKKVHAILIDYQQLIDDKQIEVIKGPIQIFVQDEDQKYVGQRNIILSGNLQNLIQITSQLQKIGYQVQQIQAFQKEIDQDQVSEEQYINTYQQIIKKGLNRAQILCNIIYQSSQPKVYSIKQIIPEVSTQEEQQRYFNVEEGQDQEDDSNHQDIDTFELVQNDQQEYITLEFEVRCLKDDQQLQIQMEENQYRRNRYKVMDDDDDDL